MQITGPFVLNALINGGVTFALYRDNPSSPLFGFPNGLAAPDVVVTCFLTGLITWIITGSLASREFRIKEREWSHVHIKTPGICFNLGCIYKHLFRTEDLFKKHKSAKKFFAVLGKVLLRGFLFGIAVTILFGPLCVVVLLAIDWYVGISFNIIGAMVFKCMFGGCLGTFLSLFVFYLALLKKCEKEASDEESGHEATTMENKMENISTNV
jgi:hypothetical protein